MADVNLTRHFARLTGRMQNASWREFWDYLDVRVSRSPISALIRPMPIPSSGVAARKETFYC